jgi:hypothetical protein
VTAIRNADLNDKSDTARDATWEPLDSTPMHPEYPCAHCILSGAARVVLESLGQPMPELTLTSPTAPGVISATSLSPLTDPNRLEFGYGVAEREGFEPSMGF